MPSSPESFCLSIEMERYQTCMALLDNSYNYITAIKTFSLNIAQEANPILRLHALASQLISESGIDTKMHWSVLVLLCPDW